MENKKLNKTKEIYFTMLGDVGDYEPFTIEKNLESGQIRIEIYQDRWRMPDETVKVLQDAISAITNNFYPLE